MFKISGKGIPLCCILLLLLILQAYSQILSLAPDDTLYFGRIPEGKTAVRMIGIRNLDRAQLQVASLRIEGNNASLFTIINNPGAFTVNFLERRIFEVRFQPGAEGNFSAKLVVESNAKSGKNNTVFAGSATDLNAGFIAFERIFGGTESDGAGSVRVTNDGGFIIAGSTQLFGIEFNDATLIKTDAYGQIEWSQLYGEESWGEGFAETIPTADDGYIAVGTKADSDHNLPPDVWIVKTDATGTEQWQKKIGDNESDVASYVIQAADGSYLVSGTFQHDTAQRQDDDALLIKLDSNGNILWQKTYGGSAGEEAGCVQQTADGGFVLVGSTTSFGAGEHDVYLVKLDANGIEQWSKTYGGTDWDKASKVITTDDGGYFIAGWTANFGAQARDVYLIKTDAAGKEQWYKFFGDAHKDAASDMIQTTDGGYLIVGNIENTYFSSSWRTDGYVIKIDGSGNEQWSRTFGKYNDEGFSCVEKVGDGGYIISGTANSYGNSSEMYLLKIDKGGGFTSVSVHNDIIPGGFRLQENYPNPFNASTTLRYRLPQGAHMELCVYNIHGQKIRTLENGYKQAGEHTLQFNADNLASGFYFYRLKANELVETKRMLLLK